MSEALRVMVLIAVLSLCPSIGTAQVVGKMGAAELQSAELKVILDSQPPDARRQLATDSAAMDRLIRSELMRKAVLIEARQKGWDKRPELQPLIERARDQVIVNSFVGSVAQPGEGYPSEDEIRQFYESNKAQMLAPPQYRIAQIFLPVADGPDKGRADEAKRKIVELRAKAVKPGADFAKLASERAEAGQGPDKQGDLGWLSKEQMVSEVRHAVSGMSKGEVSPPVRSAAGWHLIKLLDRRTAAMRPLADIRPSLIGAMRNRKAQDMEHAYFEALAIKLPPAIDRNEVARLQSGLR